MATCNIPKYDALPAVVGVIDVDCLRYQLRALRSDAISDRIAIFFVHFIISKEAKERLAKDTEQMLEAARRMHVRRAHKGDIRNVVEAL